MITIEDIKSILKADTGFVRHFALTYGAVSKVAGYIRTNPQLFSVGVAWPRDCSRNTKRSNFLSIATGNESVALLAQSIVIAFEQERVRQGN